MLKKPFVQGRPDFASMETEVITYWDKTEAFAKSVNNRSQADSYIFYDGPPFANGLPHYGHLLGSTCKDVIPRYQTMRGKKVERIWGWDCHGVPIENAIEKQLGLKGGKKGIENLGIAKFNEACRTSIMAYDQEWQKTIKRLGRWVDFEHAYKTMDASYMESVWWGFSQLYKKGLIYQGRKVILFCPRCSTPLSNFEIAMDNSYQDTEDWSLYVKFKIAVSDNEFFLAWTTTPWTLPGNVALAVLPDASYVQIEHISVDNLKEYYWVAKDRLQAIAKLMGVGKPKIIKTARGRELEGIAYKPLYTYMPVGKKQAYYVTTAPFVSLEEGSGIVHTAAIFGEDDYKLAQEKDLPCIPTLDDQGKFLEFVTPLAGVFYKKAEDFVIEDLKSRNLVFHVSRFTHSYPFCYRCGTPLYFSAQPAWFINVQALKPQLHKANEAINWYPEHLKYGRFGKGLETAPDWNISRSRYWGTPMPIWQNDQYSIINNQQTIRRIIGSIAELKHWAVDPKQVEKLTDLHREFLDPIEVWVDDARTIKGKRVSEVFDCWVESGSMPFAQVHYPFENKSTFEKTYPSQFITEYIAQTRAWFYCMHVISVGIFGSHAFENCLTTGTLQAEDGQKMSKSKKNYPDPMMLIDKYGSDCLRLYLMSSPIMRAENMNFSDKNVHEVQNKVINILWNIYGFYALYVQNANTTTNLKIATVNYQLKTLHVMDRWLLSKASHLVESVTAKMDAYDLVSATHDLADFLTEFSTWYLRLSRKRLKLGDHEESGQVFVRVLVLLCKLYAPFIPFITETIFQNITSGELSIHLTDWPDIDSLKVFSDKDLETQMRLIMQATESAHNLRKENQLKVRQPLAKLTVTIPGAEPSAELSKVLGDEINVESVVWVKGKEFSVTLDTTLTPDLVQKGKMREAVRVIQDLRKAGGVRVDQFVDAWLPQWPEVYESEIKKKTLVRSLRVGEARIKLPLE